MLRQCCATFSQGLPLQAWDKLTAIMLSLFSGTLVDQRSASQQDQPDLDLKDESKCCLPRGIPHYLDRKSGLVVPDWRKLPQVQGWGHTGPAVSWVAGVSNQVFVLQHGWSSCPITQFPAYNFIGELSSVQTNSFLCHRSLHRIYCVQKKWTSVRTKMSPFSGLKKKKPTLPNYFNENMVNFI